MPSRRSGGRPKQDQLVFGIWSKYYTTYTTSPVAVHSGRRTAQPGALVKTVPCPGGDASFAACSSPGAARNGSPAFGRTTVSRRSAGTRQEWNLARDSVAVSQSRTWTVSGHRAGPGACVQPLPAHRGPGHGATTAAVTTSPRNAADSPSGFSRAGAPAPSPRARTEPSSGSSRRADGAPAGVACIRATHPPVRGPAGVPAPTPPAAHRCEGPHSLYGIVGPRRRRSPGAERRARPRAPEAPVSQALWRHDEKQRRRWQGLSEGPAYRHPLGPVAHQAAGVYPWQPERLPDGRPRWPPEGAKGHKEGDVGQGPQGPQGPQGQVAARTLAPEQGKPKKRVHWRRRQASRGGANGLGEK